MRKVLAFLLPTAICLTTFASAQQADTTWQIGPFVRLSNKPVISPQRETTFLDPVSGKQVAWEELNTFNPAAITRNGHIFVLYRAEDSSGKMAVGGHTSRIGLAESKDGIHFRRNRAPVLFPAQDDQSANEVSGGVEDPRIVQSVEGTYYLTYTQYARERNTYTIGIATSRDLRRWDKHGPVFAGASEGAYDKMAYKSAGIVTQLKDGHVVAAQIHGAYYMFWGEVKIRLATSTDLIHWQPVEESPGHPAVLMEARPGYFDSAFPEVGPPPLLTDRGIVVIYNAKNAVPKTSPDAANAPQGDPMLAPGTYSVGEALFSADDPRKLLARTDEPVFKPQFPFERSGQYAAGTTFAEGLAYRKGRWYLYYGCADSYVAAATTK